MVYSNDLRVEEKPAVALLRDLAGGAGILLWRMVRLPVFVLLAICEPVFRIGLTLIALLGVLTSVVLEFSGSAPHFPFWGALAFFVGCGALPSLYHVVMRLFAP